MPYLARHSTCANPVHVLYFPVFFEYIQCLNTRPSSRFAMGTLAVSGGANALAVRALLESAYADFFYFLYFLN